MQDKRKRLAFIAIGILLITLFFSYGYILKNADHTCSGDECPICIQLELVVQVIESFKWLFDFGLCIMSLMVFCQITYMIYQYVCMKLTLIRLKVELLD